MIGHHPTIYWNPTVTTNPGTGTTTVSFFSADLPGKYRIVVEGVPVSGESVRCVNYIDVNKN